MSPQRPDDLALGLEAHLVAAFATGTRGPPVGAAARTVGAHPGGLATIGHQHLDGGRRRPDRPAAGVRDDALGAAVLERAPDPVHAGVLDQVAGDGRQRGVQALRGERAGDPVQRLGLGRPRLRLGGAIGPDPRQPPDHEGHEQEQDEVEPLAGIRDDQGQPRFDEQQVVDDEGGDGGDDARGGAQAGGDDHDRDEIDRRAVQVTAARGLDDGDGNGRDRQHDHDERGGTDERQARPADGLRCRR